MTRRLNWCLLALLLMVGLPYYWLVLDNRPGDVPAKPVSMAKLRELASAMPGSAPTAVEMERTAFVRLPGTFFAAGMGIKRQMIGVMAFRLPVPGAGPIMIDSGITQDDAAALQMEHFDANAARRVDAALRSASAIILTHEHVDHQGGGVALGVPAVLGKVHFNPAQLPGNGLTNRMAWPKDYAPIARISGTQPKAIARGVVAIPAPSHTPGSQMIFVRLADGREYLFTGDIATLAANWRELRAGSRLAGEIIGDEDRREVFAWLRTIRALKVQAPDLEVIAGHDYYWITHARGERGVVRGFRQ